MSNRLSAQSPETRQLLEIAAVIGVEVPLDLWEELSDTAPEALSLAYQQARELGLVHDIAWQTKLRLRSCTDS